MNFDVLKDYQPQKIKDDDGFEVIKARGLTCAVNYARIEEYTGEKEEWKGVEFFRYELVVLNHPDHTGRRFWKSVDMRDENKLKRLADIMFTLGLEFKTREELEECGAKLSEMIVGVSAWGWKPPDSEDTIQLHKITGITEINDEEITEDTPF